MSIENECLFHKYRAIDAANKSLIAIAIKKTFKHVREYQINPPIISAVQQKNFNMGHLYECLLICTVRKDMTDFYEKFAVLPDLNLRTKIGKADKAEFEKNNKGKIIVSQDEVDKAQKMADSALLHPAIKHIFDCEFNTSVAVTAIDPLTNEPIKGLIDVLPVAGSIVIDIKTCIDASPAGASKQIANFSYYLQAFMYLYLLNLNGRKVGKFLFLMTEKEPPFASAVYILSAESIEYGRIEYERLIKSYSAAKKSGNWQGYSDHIEEICLPSWMIGEEQVTFNGVSISG